MSLGSRLRKERERRNWSQVTVAKKIGITNAVLSNYERNYRDPDTDTLKRLAKLYHVTTDYLLGRDDIESMTDEEIDEEIREIMQEVNVWYKDEPEDRKEKLIMLRKIIKAFTESN